MDPELETDSGKGNYKAVTALKKRYPGLHVLISVGGWADTEDGDKTDKYLELVRLFFPEEMRSNVLKNIFFLKNVIIVVFLNCILC